MGSDRNSTTLVVFERILSVTCLILYLSLVQDWQIYFGADSDLLNKFISGPIKPFWLDPLSFWPQHAPIVFILFLSINVWTIVGKSNWFFRFLKYACLQALHQRLWSIGDGGMNLLILTHLYLCFFQLPIKVKFQSEINRAVGLLIKGQFVLFTTFSANSGRIWTRRNS